MWPSEILGLPPSGFRVMMFTIALFRHTFIQTSGQFPPQNHLQHQIKSPHLATLVLSKQNTNISQALSEIKIGKPILASNNLHARRKTPKSPESFTRRKKNCFLLLFMHFFDLKCLLLSNKKNLRSISLAYCSEIYTKNVHTWAAINITWHYVSSYENVQNVNVFKNYFAVDFYVPPFKQDPKASQNNLNKTERF